MTRSISQIFLAGKAGAYVCCALALFACSSRAYADDLSPSEVKEDAAYRAMVREALAEYDARHFEEARIIFRRAHELAPNARTLRGIGMASFELRDYVTAVHALSASLVETRKALSLEQRTHAQGLLERSRLFVDIYALKVTPSDARVLIDGRPPENEADGTVLLGFGAHNIEVTKPSYVLRTFSVSVRGGERKELLMTLERKPQPVARSVVEEPALVAKKSPGSTGASSSRTYWLLAAGAAGLIAAGTGGEWIFENDQLKSCRDSLNASSGRRCYNQSSIETSRNLSMGVTLVSGVAAVTMAVIGILSGSSSQSTGSASAQASPVCAVLPSGVVCSKAF